MYRKNAAGQRVPWMGIDANDTDLEVYALKSPSGTITVVLDMKNRARQTLRQVSISVGTTAKSLINFIDDATTLNAAECFAYVRSVSGTCYINECGNRSSGVNNGVTSGMEPNTTVNARQLVAGVLLGDSGRDGS